MASNFVLLDRDGIINRRIPLGYVTSWNQFIFLPGVLEGLRRLTGAGISTVVVSNQAGVGKGVMPRSALDRITRRFVHKVRAHGGSIAGVYYCPHRKEEHCKCRKPQPGLLIQAQRHYHFNFAETWLIGDSISDLIAAERAGCRAILVSGNPAGFLKDSARSPQLIVPDFLSAVEIVLRAPTAAL